MVITVLAVKVLVNKNKYHPDEVRIEVALPNGLYPFRGNAVMKLQVAQGKGKDWVEDYLASELPPDKIEFITV